MAKCAESLRKSKSDLDLPEAPSKNQATPEVSPISRDSITKFFLTFYYVGAIGTSSRQLLDIVKLLESKFLT